MKTTLIFLGVLAVILAIFAYFAVFGAPTGSYAVSPLGSGDSASSSLVSLIFSTSTVTSTVPGMSSSSEFGEPGELSATGSSSAIFGTSFGTSPLSWPEGNSTISITAVALQGTQMTFTLMVQMGAAPECVPLNLRLVADEEGDLDPPNPASFTFPDSGNCNGSPSETYENQTTTFTVDPTQLPLLFTTGGASNIFFEVATTTGNGLNVDFPGTSG